MRSIIMKAVLITTLSAIITAACANTPIQKEYINIGIVGASYETGQGRSAAPQFGAWYLSGDYKTWTDWLMTKKPKLYHVLNHAEGGSVIDEAYVQLLDLILATPDYHYVGIPPFSPPSTIDYLVIGPAINTLLFAPVDPAEWTQHIIDVYHYMIDQPQISGAKIIVLGWPRYEDVDIAAFAGLFGIEHFISQTDYTTARESFYAEFSGDSDSHVFVDAFCGMKTFDGLHPTLASTIDSANIIFTAIKRYESTVRCR